MYTLINAETVGWAKNYKGEFFHAMLCDPPYHLVSPVSTSGSRPNDDLNTKKYNQFNKKGFMGKTWDGGDIAFKPETWKAFYDILYPGAFIMAFASSRGWHRLAVAIEDAGFVIHPTIFCWAQGQGFPKATRIKNDERFNEYRYGLQALKPAIEPIIVAQRPYNSKAVDNIAATGAGALNIGKARIGTKIVESSNGSLDVNGIYSTMLRNPETGNIAIGRWPANFVIVHSDECTDIECVVDCPVRKLGKQGGESTTKRIEKPSMCDEKANTWGGTFQRNRGARGYTDSGIVSRFFFNANWNAEVEERLENSDPVRYEKKVARKEKDAGLGHSALDAAGNADGNSRNSHPTVKPIVLNKWLATLLLPPKEYAPRRILIPFAGAASEMIGAMQAGWDEITGIEMEKEYTEIGQQRLKYWEKKFEDSKTLFD